MTLEFERCQAEERERIEFFKETLLQFHKLTDISQAVQDAHATCLARLQQVSPPRDLELFARDFGVDMPMIIPDADGNWYLEGSTPPSQGGAAYSSSSGVASKADGTTGSGAANTSVVSTDSAAGAQLSKLLMKLWTLGSSKRSFRGASASRRRTSNGNFGVPCRVGDCTN